MSDELKPCPFCGAKAGIFPGLPVRKWTAAKRASVYCTNEDCGIDFNGFDLSKLIEKWNTRQ